MTAVGLLMSVPLYADAVYFRLLRETVIARPASTVGTPLSFRFRYVGARDGALQIENIQVVNDYLKQKAPGDLHLATKGFVSHFKTNIGRVYQKDDDPAQSKGITWVSFGTLNDLAAHIQLVAGKMPAVSGSISGSTIEVLIHADVAEEFRWNVGDEYIVKYGGLLIPIYIAGTWAPADSLAKFWSSPLEELALVPEETFAGRISPYLENEIYLGIWQVLVDGGKLHVSDISELLVRVEQVKGQAAVALPKIVMDDSPVSSLQAYQKGVPELTFLLLAFSVPIIGLLLAFIGLVVGLYVERQRNQIAMLRSRGATKAQVIGIAALEGGLLGILALGLGSLFGMVVARLIGQARSFLNFSAPPDLRVGLTSEGLITGLAAVALVLAAQLLPTLGAAGHTILTYKQERARLLRPTWWQRIWLDVLLLIPTVYSFYILQKQGSLAAKGGTAVTDIFQNPLLFLTPALGMFALTLFLARIMPWVMTLVSWISARSNSVGLMLAARQLARAPGLFTAPLMLLTLTLSLSAFTASLAQTLDTHLIKQMYYRAGADLRLAEEGIETGVSAGGRGARWLFKPVEVHLKTPGVKAAARVGRYKAVILTNPTPLTAIYIGVDRLSFPQAAYWQRDFASQPLNGLMNELARLSEGVLASSQFLTANNLKIGDMIGVVVTPVDESKTVNMQIVGAFDLFPTWYPEDGPVLVGNLEFINEQFGRTYPYEVWLATDDSADHRQVVAHIKGLTALMDKDVDPGTVVDDGLNIMVRQWRSAAIDIFAEQRRPQRQGLFGLLSVGFVASALLTVIGFLLYALFSFQRRFIELGVLRAVGLSTRQMIILLAWELASLILVGMAAGTGLGVWISAWFIPYLQVGVEASSRFPPFVVQIAWPAILRIYILFGVLFLGALGGLTALLVRMKVFQAIKLGETL
jgi:putative ABC transport system permease protein